MNQNVPTMTITSVINAVARLAEVTTVDFAANVREKINA